jgi:hypothetical protein
VAVVGAGEGIALAEGVTGASTFGGAGTGDCSVAVSTAAGGVGVIVAALVRGYVIAASPRSASL